MKKTLTNEKATAILEGLSKFRNSDAEISIETGYRIVQNIKQLSDALEPFMAERNRIIKKYSDNGESISPQDKNYVLCCRDINTLLKISIEVDVFEISFDEIKALKVPMNCINALMFITQEAI